MPPVEQFVVSLPPREKLEIYLVELPDARVRDLSGASESLRGDLQSLRAARRVVVRGRYGVDGLPHPHDRAARRRAPAAATADGSQSAGRAADDIERPGETAWLSSPAAC